MPIWEKTKEKYKDCLEFVLSCDCGDFECHKILFSYFKDDNYKELYLCDIPNKYPIPFRDLFKRIKFALNYLIHGEIKYKDSLVIYPETLKDFINNLQYVYNNMVGDNKKFSPYIYTCEEFVSFEPDKDHVLIIDIPEEGMLNLMRSYIKNLNDKEFKSKEFLSSLKNIGLYIEDYTSYEASSLSLDDAINIDLIYANNFLK